MRAKQSRTFGLGASFPSSGFSSVLFAGNLLGWTDGRLQQQTGQRTAWVTGVYTLRLRGCLGTTCGRLLEKVKPF
jgi:hypothetical protein